MNYLGEIIHRYYPTFAALASLRRCSGHALREKSSFVFLVSFVVKGFFLLWLRPCRAGANRLYIRVVRFGLVGSACRAPFITRNDETNGRGKVCCSPATGPAFSASRI